MTENERMILSVTEVAKILGISRNLVYSGVIRGEIPCIKIGKRILVPKVAFERMLNAARPVANSSARGQPRGPPRP
jgi:excisionase family DNA binding protein